MAYETIKYDIADNILTITLNRPEKLNAFNAKMQPVVDRVHQQHANQPVDQVRQALNTAWRQAAGKDLPEPTLTNAATQISQGKRVELRNAS